MALISECNILLLMCAYDSIKRMNNPKYELRINLATAVVIVLMNINTYENNNKFLKSHHLSNFAYYLNSSVIGTETPAGKAVDSFLFGELLEKQLEFEAA